MLADHHCSSKGSVIASAINKARFPKLPVCMTVFALALAGCNTTKPVAALDVSSIDPATTASIESSQVETTEKPKNSSSQEAELSTDDLADAQQKLETAHKTTTQKDAELDFQTTSSLNKSAHCRYLEADANAQAEILASPTLGASTDDDGSYSVNIGMNLLDFKKAKLVRETGQQKCLQKSALKSVETNMRTLDEATRTKAANAKYTYIKNNLGRLTSINKLVNSKVSVGEITRQQAALVKLKIRQLKADMASAKAIADRQGALPKANPTMVSAHSAQLRASERRLQEINEEMRTLDALRVNVEGGYRQISQDEIVQSNSTSDDLYAKLNVGVRLGALSPKRREYERLAHQARQEALDEEQQGILWLSKSATDINRRAARSLRSAEKQLVANLAEVNRNRSVLRRSRISDVVLAKLQADVEAISIGTSLAEIRAALANMERNSK